ncbi:hypothetical protein IG193_02245 [Infirmifilum lucidum]|uniref:Uncharacterized protein n=1 Tax=Infirmifilum lucidum TaxID=2776706 RepID=A0A7L9FKA7_9CREN|nr:hypothetical protein [Infirmifilum lucidum]QOJ79306.1 hypothetical protein IG193_02245 [Infirmifilum lucidum]
MEDILSILSAIGGIGGLATVLYLSYWLGGKFREIDMRFKEIDMRFEEFSARFREVDRRFEEINKRFNEVDKKFDAIDRRFDDVNRRIEGLEERLSRLEERVDRRLERLAYAFISYQEFLTGYFVSEGVLKPSAASLVVTEARNLMRLAVSNPFTKDEWKRLGDLLDKSEKEELTLEEAQELLNLARKAVMEYGEYPEAWKLHMYAAIMVGLAYKRMKEREKQQGEKS